MKWVLATLLALALAGCADSGNFDREKAGRSCRSDRANLAPYEAGPA